MFSMNDTIASFENLTPSVALFSVNVTFELFTNERFLPYIAPPSLAEFFINLTVTLYQQT